MIIKLLMCQSVWIKQRQHEVCSIFLCFLFTADPGVFVFSPATVTLQPNETSTIVSISVIDNQIAQDDNNSFKVSAESQFGSESIPITIRDNDREYYNCN